MGIPEDVTDYFERRTGVLKVRRLSDRDFSDIWGIEMKVRTQTQSDYENLGFKEISKRGHRICLFVDDSFTIGSIARVTMVDSRDNILGITVYESEKEQYEGREDVIWLSKDFAMFTGVEAVGRERFVLSPFDMTYLTEEVDGCRNAVGGPHAQGDDGYADLVEDLHVPHRFRRMMLRDVFFQSVPRNWMDIPIP